MQQEQKLIWADNLRALATISVVLLHVAAPVLYKFGSVSNFVWWTGNIYDSAVRFCVPVFVMLTGMLLLRKEEGLGNFLKKRLSRVVIPFIFWSLVYIAFNLSVNNLAFGKDTGLVQTIKWAFAQLKYGSSYHLWYVYMIIGIYLIIPIIGKWIRSSSKKEMLYFLTIWLIAPILNIFLFNEYRFYTIDLSYFSGFTGYLVLGYYLSLQPADNRNTLNKLALPLIITGIALTALGTYYLSNNKNKFVEDLYGSFTPNVLAVSTGLFLVSKRITITNRKVIAIRDFINKYSFGIYLVHVLVLTFLEAMGIYWNLINPLAGIAITTILCVSLSAILIYFINKLPFGKYISG